MRTGGDRFGTHRVLSPRGVLPQQADKLDASLPIFENEILVEVDALNIDSASFHQIKEFCGHDTTKMKAHITELVRSRGKHHNPVTGSGGMLVGTVKQIGPKFFSGGRENIEKIKVGDPIATLVSLTLTPLEIKQINDFQISAERIDIEGHAILFQSGIFAKLPQDIPQGLALAILDVCGAPAQTEAMCKPGQTVVVVGGGGKSGLLCLYEAKKAVGKSGKVIAMDYSHLALNELKEFSFIDAMDTGDARNALEFHEKIKKLTDGKMADVVINVTNIPDTEMSCILSTKQGGVVYFFSMATSFTKAALGAEGVGAHVDLVIGNGYRPGHAEMALNILRDSQPIREFYERKYGTS